jgi:nitrite reductase/ring-hydroxylating ferredoxin subunit/uncharacterized membrane protein
MLVGFPAAYLFGSACIDACATAADRPDWFRTARHMRTLGIATALVAAVPGIIDYVFAVPPKSSAKTRATNHMIANVSALALFGLARIEKRADGERPSRMVMTAELLGAGLVAFAGWLGGTLVFRNQIAVDHRFANAGKWRVAAIPESQIQGERVDAGSDDQLRDEQIKLLRVGARRIALGRTKGRLVAFADRCTHKGGPLSDGTLACGIVQCPWHGSQFNVSTGTVEQGPADQPIETYDVDSTGGRAMVALTPRS